MPLWRRTGLSRAVLALSAARLGDSIGNSLLFVVMPVFIVQLPSPWFPWPASVRAGVYISLFGFVSFAVQPVAGAIVDRLNRRKVFVTGGLALLATATASYAFVDRFALLLAVRVFQSVGASLTLPATMAILANVTRTETRGGAMGWYTTFRVGGLALGPMLGGALYEAIGAKVTFYAAAGLILLGMVAVQLWVQEVKAESAAGPHRILDGSVLSARLLTLGFATFVMSTSFAMVAPLEAKFDARLDVGALLFGIAFSSLMVTRIIVQVPIGRLSDRHGRRGFIIAGLLLMAVSSVPVGFVGAVWQLIALRVLQGLASGAIAAPVFALAADYSRSGGEGRQMSVVTMGFGLGIAFGTLVGGILGASALWLPFLVAAAVNLVAAGAVARWARPPARADASLRAHTEPRRDEPD